MPLPIPTKKHMHSWILNSFADFLAYVFLCIWQECWSTQDGILLILSLAGQAWNIRHALIKEYVETLTSIADLILYCTKPGTLPQKANLVAHLVKHSYLYLDLECQLVQVPLKQGEEEVDKEVRVALGEEAISSGARMGSVPSSGR